jgi:iron complex transport system ATP-binding protein
MSFSVEEVRWSAGRTLIIDGVSLDVPDGAFVGVLGPNGSGKSSLLRLMAGLAAPTGGRVRIGPDDLSEVPGRERALRIALVAQETVSAIDYTLREVVLLGRIPHRSRLAPPTSQDEDIVDAALEELGLLDLAHREWASLSGGERQRANIARAFVQRPTDLLLDEFTNHLDIHHQLGILETLRSSPMTVVAALHDLELAARYCSALVVLHHGRVVAAGRATEVITASLLRDVYRVEASISIARDLLSITYHRPIPQAAAFAGAQKGPLP